MRTARWHQLPGWRRFGLQFRYPIAILGPGAAFGICF